MNRVLFEVLEQNTSIKWQELKLLNDIRPKQIAFTSEKFPLYPMTINMYLENPPFNKFSISFQNRFCPARASLYGSEDNKKYVKILDMTDLNDREQVYVKIFKEKFFFQYVKVVMDEPSKTNENLCKQIKLKGIELSLVNFYNTRFACSLQAKLTYHPILFRLLEVLQYKYLLLRQNQNNLCQKYQKRLEELINTIATGKIDKVFPEASLLQKWDVEISEVENEPVYMENYFEHPDPVLTKKSINQLQKELNEFSIDRASSIKPHVLHYFEKYRNKQVKEGYLRELSSTATEDQNRALISFWSDVKKLEAVDVNTEEAILMFFNYFLQYIDSPLKTSALKILILFNKNNKNSKNQKLAPIYERILHNIVKFVHQKQDEELFNLSLRYCYMLYDRIDNELFIKQLLNAYKSYTLAEQLQKLQILEKVTFRSIEITDRREIISFLTEILLRTEITLTEKNRAYNIAAYLASILGKESIMKDFEKLNTMILMTMQKNIDTKLVKIRHQPNQQEEQAYSCQFCGTHDSKFQDQNLLDLHLAKQCKYITNCIYCQQNVQIPELFKHYAEQCKLKHQFKHCDNCFQVILIKDQQKHNEKCLRKLITRCPLCYQKMDSKLKLKEHLLTTGCPNNPR